MENKQRQFFDIYKNYKPLTVTTFTNLFRKAGNIFTSKAVTIDLKNMIEIWRYAGIGINGEALTSLARTGISVLSVTPPQIGSTDSFENDELLELDSSTAIESGEIVDMLKKIETRKVNNLSQAYTNSLEFLSQTIFTTGSYDGNSFGLPAIESLALDSSTDLGLQIVELIEKFELNKGYECKIMAGSDIIGALLNQSRDTTNADQQSSVKNLPVASGDRSKTYRFLIGAYDVVVEKFPLIRNPDGSFEDTSSSMTLYAEEALGIAFAGIKAPTDGSYPKILEQEVLLDLGKSTDPTSPDTFIFIKGNPLPIIAEPELFIRYDVTLV